eukprot:3388789-Rhodomonas_salina.1
MRYYPVLTQPIGLRVGPTGGNGGAAGSERPGTKPRHRPTHLLCSPVLTYAYRSTRTRTRRGEATFLVYPTP